MSEVKGESYRVGRVGKNSRVKCCDTFPNLELVPKLRVLPPGMCSTQTWAWANLAALNRSSASSCTTLASSASIADDASMKIFGTR